MRALGLIYFSYSEGKESFEKEARLDDFYDDEIGQKPN
jgi:hypothetical protein